MRFCRIEVPRGREERFEPIPVPKHGRHFTGFDDGGMAEAPAWQARPLEILHLVVLFDGLRFKIGEDAMARDKAVCSAGPRRSCPTEHATFWDCGLRTPKVPSSGYGVFNDLKTRDVLDS